MSEPIFLVIERGVEGEIACIYRERLFSGTKRRAVYTLRIDRLPPEQQDYWLSKSTTELLACYRWLKGEGTLPAQNLADPPREKPQQGSLRGPETWWTQPKNPWPDRSPDPLPDLDSLERRA